LVDVGYRARINIVVVVGHCARHHIVIVECLSTGIGILVDIGYSTTLYVVIGIYIGTVIGVGVCTVDCTGTVIRTSAGAGVVGVDCADTVTGGISINQTATIVTTLVDQSLSLSRRHQ